MNKSQVATCIQAGTSITKAKHSCIIGKLIPISMTSPRRKNAYGSQSKAGLSQNSTKKEQGDFKQQCYLSCQRHNSSVGKYQVDKLDTCYRSLASLFGMEDLNSFTKPKWFRN